MSWAVRESENGRKIEISKGIICHSFGSHWDEGTMGLGSRFLYPIPLLHVTHHAAYNVCVRGLSSVLNNKFKRQIEAATSNCHTPSCNLLRIVAPGRLVDNHGRKNMLGAGKLMLDR